LAVTALPDDLPDFLFPDLFVVPFDLPEFFFEPLPLTACLPLAVVEPDDAVLRERNGGTGSFQLNASICAPT